MQPVPPGRNDEEIRALDDLRRFPPPRNTEIQEEDEEGHRLNHLKDSQIPPECSTMSTLISQLREDHQASPRNPPTLYELMEQEDRERLIDYRRNTNPPTNTEIQEEDDEQLIDVNDPRIPPLCFSMSALLTQLHEDYRVFDPTFRQLRELEDRNKRIREAPTVLDQATRARFLLQESIGKVLRSTAKVYKATTMFPDWADYETMQLQEVLVTLKCIKADQETEALNNLKERVERNSLVPDHPNIMGIKNTFNCEGNYYVVFPFMEFGSLRSIMNKKHPHGLPEDCVIVAIREALKGLSFIHEKGQCHREISADRIFLSGGGGQPQIKLAFSASVYDCGLDESATPSPFPSSSSFLPMASLTDWAAAPEVYGTEDGWYMKQSDMWLIGITALELAYGKIKVRERSNLDSLIKWVSKKKSLPLRREGQNSSHVSSSSRKGNLSPHCMDFEAQFKKREFSKKFEKMVVKCLHRDPSRRPTAKKLLKSKIFTKNQKDVSYFLSTLMET